MFRTTDFFHSIASIARSVRGAEPLHDGSLPPPRFEPEDEALALMPVYSEIARRLSRNAYTSHGAA